MVNEECLVCGAPLEYLQEDEIMECALCHKKMASRTRCVKGHFVCDECHTSGMDSVMAVCLRSNSKNPIEIINLLMSQPFCHFHGPEHHVLVGSALLQAQFLSRYPYRYRFREGTFRGANGKICGQMRSKPRQQPMHRQTVPVSLQIVCPSLKV